MASSSLRIGVIGVGFGTTVQISGFQSEGVEVTAVFACRRESLQEAADQSGIPGVYDDYNACCEMPPWMPSASFSPQLLRWLPVSARSWTPCGNPPQRDGWSRYPGSYRDR